MHIPDEYAASTHHPTTRLLRLKDGRNRDVADHLWVKTPPHGSRLHAYHGSTHSPAEQALIAALPGKNLDAPTFWRLAGRLIHRTDPPIAGKAVSAGPKDSVQELF